MPVTRPPPRPPGAPTCPQATGSLPPCRSNGSCWPPREASAPGSRRPSRPWRGWSASSSLPSTAITRSSTTVTSSTNSGPRGSSSSTTWTRSPPGHRSCSRPTGRLPRSWPTPAGSTGWSSTPSARSSPRSTTSSRSAPARATPSSTSATRVTRRPSAPWRWRRPSVRLVQSEDDVDQAPVPPGSPVALLAQTTLSHDEWSGIMARAKVRFPDLWMPEPVRPLLRHHQPPGGAEGDRRARRRRRRHRLGQLVEHPGPGEGGAGVGLPPGAARQHRRRAPRRPVGHRRRHRRCVGPRRAGARRWWRAWHRSRAMEEVRVTDEDEYFPPPPEMRDLLGALARGAGPGARGTATGGRPSPPAVPSTTWGRCRATATSRPPTSSPVWRGEQPSALPLVQHRRPAAGWWP